MAKNIIGNRLVDDGDLSFFQWLNIYKFVTKKEYRFFLDCHKDVLKKEYEDFIKQKKEK